MKSTLDSLEIKTKQSKDRWMDIRSKAGFAEIMLEQTPKQIKKNGN